MYLLRHGQSEFNVTYAKTRVDPNIPDPELTDEGRVQIHAAAQHLKDKDITKIVASPYTRTLQTAEIISDILNLPIQVEELIREHAFFSCDIGSPSSKLSQDWPHLDFEHIPECWWPDLNETEHQVKLRGQEFQKKMLAFSDWSKTLVVSHWAFIRGLTGQEVDNGAILNIDLQSLSIDSAISTTK
ncbi:histidine phosphatase family protein [Kiloniella sp.]|uniref:histidine phosphatase family protein n=1 Tax=Kiloniella sp. TaxID=1938587 RepID=UPI003A90BAE5